MKSCWDYLVEHEKAVIVVTLFLVFALFWQLKSKNAHSEPTTDSLQTRAGDDAANRAGRSSDAARNVAGVWEMSVQKKNGTQNWTLKLKQDGERLTGVINSEGGDLPVAGTIKGEAINLSAKRFGATAEFPATITGDIITGEMRVLTVKRQWTAKRRASER